MAYAEVKFPKIELHNKQVPPLHNNMCHINVLNNKNDKIALCCCVGKKLYAEEVFIHFINKNKRNFYDLTLGDFGKTNYDYYFIRYVDDIDYSNCEKILNVEKKNLFTKATHKKFKLKYLEDL